MTYMYIAQVGMLPRVDAVFFLFVFFKSIFSNRFPRVQPLFCVVFCVMYGYYCRCFARFVEYRSVTRRSANQNRALIQ